MFKTKFKGGGHSNHMVRTSDIEKHYPNAALEKINILNTQQYVAEDMSQMSDIPELFKIQQRGSEKLAIYNF